MAAASQPPGNAAPVRVAPLSSRDRDGWEVLARGYKAFYATPTSDAEYDTAWHRLLAGDGVHGLAAFSDDRLVGIAHYLFHTGVWARTSCYLQDLFTAPAARGRGVAGALIGAVAARARAQDASRCYWLTQDHNVVARRLYDRVGRHQGFIRYDLDLAEGPAPR